MANSIDAYCTSCGKFTYFCYDGEDWECQSCGALNSQGDHCDSENVYGED
jgi:hypothetical protein